MTKRIVALAVDDDKGLEGSVSQHFGRCPCYLLVELDGKEIGDSRIEQNPFYGNHQPGQVPMFIKEIGADVIIAGGMGPRAVDIFSRLGIEVATGAVGKAGLVLDAYLRGEVSGIVPCAHDHADSCGGH